MLKLGKCLATLMAGMLLTSSAWAAGEEAEQVVVVDPNNASPVNNGIFEGWGTSLCWWANRIGYSDTLTRLAAEAFCDPENGLGLNILRYNIGGGDDPSHDHITRTDSMMPGFWQNPSYDESSGIYLLSPLPPHRQSPANRVIAPLYCVSSKATSL